MGFSGNLIIVSLFNTFDKVTHSILLFNQYQLVDLILNKGIDSRYYLYIKGHRGYLKLTKISVIFERLFRQYSILSTLIEQSGRPTGGQNEKQTNI